MIYCISDIHGQCAQFEAMLKYIDLKANDHLYLLGDYIDKGADSISTLLLVEKLFGRENVTILQGNHDQMMYYALSDLRNHTTSLTLWDAKFSDIWKDNGGKETLQQFNAFQKSDRDRAFEILEKINGCGSEVTISLNGQKICLCHAAPKAALFPDKKLQFELAFLDDITDMPVFPEITGRLKNDAALWSRPAIFDDNFHDYSQEMWTKQNVNLVIHGHTPTYVISPTNRICEYFEHGQRIIDIDTGAQDLRKGALSCLRLDDMVWFKPKIDGYGEIRRWTESAMTRLVNKGD
jgi:serine/threonine protein phosphatase 1